MNILKTIATAGLLSLAAVAAQAGTVTKDGNILTISGEFDSRMYSAWTRLFDADVITHVKLESPGGSVYYGTKIAEDIYNNRDTIVTEAIGGCQSMCAATWLAADKHVHNYKAEIGFHLSYISDINYLDERLKEWGIRGTEWDTKAGVMRDMQDYFRYFDNPENFGIFITGITEHGLMGFHMWYPTCLLYTSPSPRD